MNDITYTFNGLHITPDLIQPIQGRRPGINIQEAIDFFVGPGHDKNSIRLPIVEEDGTIVNIVSPSMILKFLAEHMDQLPEQLINREIQRIPGCVTGEVVTIKSSDRALDAFAQMAIREFSALGCEDSEGVSHRHIMGVISLKDAGYALKDLNLLMKPVEEYVNDIRRMDLIDRAPTMNVATTDTLQYVVKKFTAVNRHRMFVRNPHTQEMVGIVTVSDVLKAFATSQTE